MLTGLRQPEVSLAMRYLQTNNWIEFLEEKKSKGKGRPVKIYRLTVSINQIISVIEEEILAENILMLRNIEFLKKISDSRGNPSVAVMKRKIGQRYLIKSLPKKKNSDWDIQKILIFTAENKCYRADSNLISSTLRVVTPMLVLPQLMCLYISGINALSYLVSIDTSSF